MRSFKHIAPAMRLFHGADSFSHLGGELDRLHAGRALVFCGSSMFREAQVLGLVRAALAHRCAGVFDGVRAHSPVSSVVAGADALKRVGADAVIALGGGSAIVTARAASILLAEQRDARSLSTSMNDRGELHSPKLQAPKLPQLVIPTTPTTAIVKAGSAISDPVSKERLALFDPKTRAHAVFVHPAALDSAPRELVISAGLDTLVFAIECLISRGGDPIADALLMQSVRLAGAQLAHDGTNQDGSWRSELVLAAILCGQGSDYTGAGIATALGHAIGAYSEVENGITKAIVLPHALRFNADAACGAIAKVAASLDVPASASDPMESVLAALRTITGRLGIPVRLRDAGLKREALPKIAASTMSDWWLRGNARPVRGAGELEQVLEQAW